MTTKKPIDLARSMVAEVEALESIPGMMVSYDLGRYAIAKAFIQMVDAAARESPEAVCDEILSHIDSGACDAMAIQTIVRRVMVKP